MICPKCGGIMNGCGVGGAYTAQLEFYCCSNCGKFYHPYYDTDEKLFTRIKEIDKEVEEYEAERERKFNKKWWEFWK